MHTNSTSSTSLQARNSWPATTVATDRSTGPMHYAPQSKAARGSDRIPGTVYSRRPGKATPEQAARRLRTIKAQQAKAGIKIERHPVPEPQCSAASSASSGGALSQLRGAANWLWEKLPSFGLESDAEDQPIGSTKTGEQTFTRGQGGLLVGEFDRTAGYEELGIKNAVPTHHEMTRTLKRFVGKDNVHFLPTPGGARPFLRNVVAEARHGMLISKIDDDGYVKTGNQAEQYFRARGIAFERLKHRVNLANVDYVPANDLLVLADSEIDQIDRATKRELTEKFGHPRNVIHLSLSNRVTEHGRRLCYDLDLAFLAMTNAKGESVALIHKPCINARGHDEKMGVDEVIEVLNELGFKVIEISDKDQRNLALNALTSDAKPGHILFPSQQVSPELLQQLEAHHITPSLPMTDKLLGHPTTSPYAPGHGIHCLTINLRAPEESVDRKKEL